MTGYFRFIPLWLFLLAGCSGNPAYQTDLREAKAISESSELLADTPFFPQRKYQCGPAALAALIGAAGLNITPEVLEPQLYIADRKGSLQMEMVAATRRQGLLPYVHAGGFDALLEQLAAGSAALVLQNLGLGWWPQWHYAVVIGYSADAERVYLRSGTTRLVAMPLRAFMRTWHDGNQWFMTVHQPGEVPAGADAEAYLNAVTGLEQAGHNDAALRAYMAATRFWPENWMGWMGLGNRHYLQAEFDLAEQAYRHAVQLAPEQPAALHNLAWSLIRQELFQQALPFAREATRQSDANHYQSALQALESPL